MAKKKLTKAQEKAKKEYIKERKRVLNLVRSYRLDSRYNVSENIDYIIPKSFSKSGLKSANEIKRAVRQMKELSPWYIKRNYVRGTVEHYVAQWKVTPKEAKDIIKNAQKEYNRNYIPAYNPTIFIPEIQPQIPQTKTQIENGIEYIIDPNTGEVLEQHSSQQIDYSWLNDADEAEEISSSYESPDFDRWYDHVIEEFADKFSVAENGKISNWIRDVAEEYGSATVATVLQGMAGAGMLPEPRNYGHGDDTYNEFIADFYDRLDLVTSDDYLDLYGE